MDWSEYSLSVDITSVQMVVRQQVKLIPFVETNGLCLVFYLLCVPLQIVPILP